MSEALDVIVIGGGQAGLAAGYHLRRAGLRFAILDAEEAPGGAWRHGWDSLRLFSPAEFSALPGWPMPPARDGGFPTRDEVVDYLTRYEQRYALPVRRPALVTAVRREGALLRVEWAQGSLAASAVISATGTWRRPVWPDYPGRDRFRGVQLHSASYRNAAPFAGQTALVVGGGNSGAQVVADLAGSADPRWVTIEPPRFLPDDVDGRVLFHRATARYQGTAADVEDAAPGGLGSIVMVPPVRAARDKGLLAAIRPFARLTDHGAIWADGTEIRADAVIWCTGFAPALEHLRSLGVLEQDGRIQVQECRSLAEPRLWLLGYGDWTGFASATLIGVGRTARASARAIALMLDPANAPGAG